MKGRLEGLGLVLDPRIELDKVSSHYDIHAHLVGGTEHFEKHLGAGERASPGTCCANNCLD